MSNPYDRTDPTHRNAWDDGYEEGSAEVARLKTACDNGTCPSAQHERAAAAQSIPFAEVERMVRAAARVGARDATEEGILEEEEVDAIVARVLKGATR